MRFLSLAAAALATSLASASAPAPSAAQPVEPTAKSCPRDVVSMRTKLIKTAVQLERAGGGGKGQMCSAYRQYADAVSRARQLFDRCNSEKALDRDLSSIDAAIQVAAAAIASNCSIE